MNSGSSWVCGVHSRRWTIRDVVCQPAKLDHVDAGQRRLVDPRDLVSAYEIAQRLGTDVVTVEQWAGSDLGMPEPVHTIGATSIRLWIWPDIAHWSLRDHAQPAGGIGETTDHWPDEELLTSRQLAERLDWKDPSTPRKMWRAGNGFPPPVKRYGRVWVWRWSDVERWARTTRRRPGRRSRTDDRR